MDSVKFGNAILALADWKETARSPADMGEQAQSDFDAEDGEDGEYDGIDELYPEEDLGLGPDQFDPDTADSDTIEGPMSECGTTTAALGLGKAEPAKTRRIVLAPFPSPKVRS
jgi:hypothetical protein